MAGVIKTNSTLLEIDVLYSTAVMKAFLITPTTALTADTQATEDAVIVEGTIRAVAQELSPLLFDVVAGGATMKVIMDGTANTAEAIDIRLTEVLGEAVTVAELDTLY